jgi:hypothetical protein
MKGVIYGKGSKGIPLKPLLEADQRLKAAQVPERNDFSECSLSPGSGVALCPGPVSSKTPSWLPDSSGCSNAYSEATQGRSGFIALAALAALIHAAEGNGPNLHASIGMKRP